MQIGTEAVAHLNIGTILVDTAALILLAGMILHTTLYRRRGRISDKLFFAMLLTDMVAALADGMNYALEGNPSPVAARMIIFGDTVFSLAFEAFCVLLVLFLDCRLHRDGERIRKRWLIYAAPAVLTAIVILTNPLSGILFYLDESNMYHYGSWYNLIFVAPLLYAGITIVQILRIRGELVILYILMIAVRVLGGFLVRGISTTAFVFAVGLAFIHILVMNHPFYGGTEEEDA